MEDRKFGLSLYRIVLTFLFLKSCLFYLPMADILFGKNAIYPISEYNRTMSYLNYNFLAYDFSHMFSSTFFLILMISVGVLFLFGEFGWVSGIILYLLFTIIRLRNPFILDGSDNVIQVTLPFLIFSDFYHYFTTNYYKRIKLFCKVENSIKGISKIINRVACCGILIQIVFVYFFTALAKLQGSLWLNGTAVFYTMRVAEFRATEWNISLTKNYFFVVLATYFTLLWELSFSFLIWFRQTKFWIILLGVVFHIGIFVFMRIDNFSWIMIGSYTVFITDSEYKEIGEKAKEILKRIKASKWKKLKTV